MVTWSAMTWGSSLPSFERLFRYSLAYADIVVNDGEIVSTGGRYNSISPDKGVHYVIMVFDSPLHLCGYGCGHPEELENGKWRVKVVSCDYDFTELYRTDHERFQETKEWKRINVDAETIAALGAVFYGYGYNDTSGKRNENNLKRQMFRTWIRKEYDELSPMDRFPDFASSVLSNERIQSMYCVFYDGDKHIIGYTDLAGSSLDTDMLKKLLDAQD